MEAVSCIQRWRGLEELRPALRTYLKRRCRDPFELEDVVQETLLRAARYRTSLEDSRRLRGWTLRIAINVLRDRLRREARRSRLEQGDERLAQIESREPIPGEEAEDARILLGAHSIGRREALMHLCQAVEELRPVDRAVLRSYYAGSQCCQVTAHECGIPTDLVKLRLFRARRRLVRAMKRRAALAERGELDRIAVVRLVPPNDGWLDGLAELEDEL